MDGNIIITKNLLEHMCKLGKGKANCLSMAARAAPKVLINLQAEEWAPNRSRLR